MKKVAVVLSLVMLLSTSLFAGGGGDKAGSSGAGTGGATNSNLLSDVRVRQAIAYAIDMDTICNTLLLGKAVPANSLTPNGDWKVGGLNDYKYDPNKARALLKEAKWDANRTLDVGYYYDDQQTVDLMTAVQAYLADVGIKANFRKISGDLNTLLWLPPNDPVNGPSAVDWDMLYGATAAMVLHEYYGKYAGGVSGNSHTPTDAALDKLIAATSATADVAKQKAAFNEVQKYENQNLFAIPLYYQPLFIFSRDNVNRVGDSNGNAQYNYDWNIVNWTVTPDASGKQILKTNSGPAQFFEYPWYNPGVYIGAKALFDRLIVADGSLSPKEGGLAESYQVSADNLSVTFTLRNNLKWHDGSAITPQDIKWSVEYALKVPAIHQVFANTFNALEGAAAFKSGAANVSGITIDGNKITFKFATLDPNMLITFGQFPPLPQKYFQGVDPLQFQQSPYWQKPIGSGPFQVKEAKMNDYIILAPFKDYYRGVAKIDEIQAYPSGENDGNLIVNANAGRIDYGYTKSSSDAIALEKIPGMKVYPVNMFYTRLFFVNKFPKK